jgi:MATE family multidrug resistance protein
VSSICYVLDGVFIGATETKPMRDTMIAATFLIFLPVYYFGTLYFGVHGLWLAMVVFMVSRGVALAYFLPKTVMELKK